MQETPAELCVRCTPSLPLDMLKMLPHQNWSFSVGGHCWLTLAELVEPETKRWGAEVGSHGDRGEKTRSHSPKPVDDLTRCGAGI